MGRHSKFVRRYGCEVSTCLSKENSLADYLAKLDVEGFSAQ